MLSKAHAKYNISALEIRYLESEWILCFVFNITNARLCMHTSCVSKSPSKNGLSSSLDVEEKALGFKPAPWVTLYSRSSLEVSMPYLPRFDWILFSLACDCIHIPMGQMH